jgi:hypothetical protein
VGTPPDRRGVIIVLTSFLLTVLFAFMALSIDTGRVVLTETEMQNAADASALAAAQEITAAVYAAGQGQGSASIDSNSIAVDAARQMAALVGEANEVFIDPDSDVQFGKRTFDPASGEWPVLWGVAPFNVVKVSVRRNNSDASAPDSELPLAFGWAIGKSSVPLQTSATAFLEARDLVLVLDVSASMNDDSSLNSPLSQSETEDLLDDMWDALVDANPTWPGTSKSKFPSGGLGEIDSYYGTYVSSTNTDTIRSNLGLNQNFGGSRKYPFPQSGRYSSGNPKPKPSNSTSDNLWNGYINYVKNLNGTYRKRYGYRTLMDYLQLYRYDRDDSEDLWRTPHYPFHAVKNGASLFLEFLGDLDFGDEVGYVAYGEWAVQQVEHHDGEVDVDISGNPITSNYNTIDTMQRRHQAGEYNGWTAMGDGILKARELLVGAAGNPNDDGYSRYGARPTMIVMTDGQTNQKPGGWSMPGNFSWSDWTDYDGDGNANYYTSNNYKKYAFWEATEAVKRGITIHTLAVGAGADRDLMRAIAFAGGGVYINVPGGTTVAEMEEQLLDAFGQVAAKVPPAKLIYEED